MPGVADHRKFDMGGESMREKKLNIEWDESEAAKESTSQAAIQAKKTCPRDHFRRLTQNVGDVDAAFSSAAKTIEAYY